MKKIEDELVNKYIDNELSNEEIIKVNSLINKDETFSLKLEMQKYVHNKLYDLKVTNAPADITDNIMNKLMVKINNKYEKNYFFRAIIATFSFMLITLLFMFFFYAGDITLVRETTESINSIGTYTKPFFDYVHKLVSTDMFKNLSAFFSFLILVVFYFSFNSHKDFKEKLKEL